MVSGARASTDGAANNNGSFALAHLREGLAKLPGAAAIQPPSISESNLVRPLADYSVVVGTSFLVRWRHVFSLRSSLVEGKS
jgi:hypothetical protein